MSLQLDSTTAERLLDDPQIVASRLEGRLNDEP